MRIIAGSAIAGTSSLNGVDFFRWPGRLGSRLTQRLFCLAKNHLPIQDRCKNCIYMYTLTFQLTIDLYFSNTSATQVDSVLRSQYIAIVHRVQDCGVPNPTTQYMLMCHSCL